MLTTPSSHSELLLTALSPSSQFPSHASSSHEMSISWLHLFAHNSLYCPHRLLGIQFPSLLYSPCGMESWLTAPQTLSHLLQAQGTDCPPQPSVQPGVANVAQFQPKGCEQRCCVLLLRQDMKTTYTRQWLDFVPPKGMSRPFPSYL